MEDQTGRRLYKVYHNNGKPIRRNWRPQRNDICPCDSGKKFKKCHVDTWDEFLREYWEARKKEKEDEGKD